MMIKLLSLLLIVVLFLGFSTSANLVLASDAKIDQRQHLSRVFLRLKPDTSLSRVKHDLPRSFQVIYTLPEIHSLVVEGDPLERKLLSGVEGVESIEADSQVRIPHFTSTHSRSLQRSSRMRNPNDPLLTNQNGLGYINAFEAWEQTTGSEAIVVAVIDTGINFLHDDLKSKVWNNLGEKAENGQDDDLNGYVDDRFGWDFENQDAFPMDDNGHGSHVSGIIGAATDNEVGIAGVTWKGSLMPLKTLDQNGTGATSNNVAAILYAVKNGAHIINASWGSPQHSKALEEAILYAESKGVLMVVASGNDSQDNDLTPHYPASFSIGSLISVSASKKGNGDLASFSNFGRRTTHLAAPGVEIFSTSTEEKYEFLSGTSMSTPFVSGVAALVKSIAPDLSGVHLRNALLNAVKERGPYRDTLMVRGDIKADLAVEQLTQGFQIWPKQIQIAKDTSFQFSAYLGSGSIEWSASPENLATINSDGLLYANEVGQVTLTAKDQDGKIAQTTKVDLIDGSQEPPQSCLPWPRSRKHSSGSQAINWGIPLAIAFVVRQKWGRRSSVPERDSGRG